MQSLVTFLVNSFDCLVRLKDSAKILTAPKDQLTYANWNLLLLSWIRELGLPYMHFAPGCLID